MISGGGIYDDTDSRGYYGILHRPNSTANREFRLNLRDPLRTTHQSMVPDDTSSPGTHVPVFLSLSGTYDNGDLILTTVSMYAGLTNSLTSDALSDPHTGDFFGIAGRLRSRDDEPAYLQVNSMTINYIPEPSTMTLLGAAGLVGIFAFRNRRRR